MEAENHPFEKETHIYSTPSFLGIYLSLQEGRQYSQSSDFGMISNKVFWISA